VPPLPQPLPPERRTVGQLVAETIRLYGRRFWLALPLGLVIAAADQVAFERSIEERVLVLLAFSPLITLAYVAASVLASGAPARWLVPLGVGTAIFLPAALTLPWFSIAAVAWLGLVGLAVPAAVIERLGPLDAVRRGYRLGRADYVHAVGGIAALVLVYSLTGPLLALLLRSQADNTARLAIFLADVVVSPILFLGSALLYYDQAARSRIERGVPRR
jgi:hypothetical protein